ncbi:MAG: molybdopterin molybdotransferase MoeA [Phaeovulum sp.]|uniref:molybdopterin molybdotransferase MoeA n=1 Tax=Phaeovulum sp. TaxID=2934796 RepID=UPI002732199E|nr:gephyrin-like molybdotransferase Glp [Phaeovulum sp.]MDP2063196.1 molybdopterin molybdotransferase MoeA [Phaeovulum sp.]
MISVDEALRRVLALAGPVGSEVVPLRAALGRVLAAPALARLTQPPFDAAAMDGYALAAADHVAGAMLRVVGEAGAGHGFAASLQPGEAVRIFTGAPVPAGAEVVVMQEDVARAGDRITLPARIDSRRHIRLRGQDFAEGQALSAPLLLQPRHLGLLAAMNLPEVTVARRPVVAVIATGDELVMPGEDPGPGQIICSNSFTLAAMAEAAGAEARMLPIARDDEAALRQAFALAAGADLIVSSGGASVGDHDLVGRVAADLGMERAFWKVAMRPGKPLMAGRMGKAVMLGLPGNPVSAFVAARLFLLPLLAAMQGLPGAHAPLRARLGNDVAANGERTHYMRARLESGPDLPMIAPFSEQDSALQRLLTAAGALLIRPPGDGPRAAGEVVEYLPL